jgi:hypothetical protein
MDPNPARSDAAVTAPNSRQMSLLHAKNRFGVRIALRIALGSGLAFFLIPIPWVSWMRQKTRPDPKADSKALLDSVANGLDKYQEMAKQVLNSQLVQVGLSEILLELVGCNH